MKKENQTDTDILKETEVQADTPEKEKKKLGYKIHLGIGAAILLVIIVAVIRLIIWNNRNSVVEPTGHEDEFETEVVDYYAYSNSHPERRGADGKKRAVVLGNYMVDDGGEHSIINMMRDKLPDWDFEDLSAELSMVSSVKHENEGYETRDGVCLFNMARALCKDGDDIRYELGAFPGYTREDLDEYVKRLQSVDLSEKDVLIIMYAFLDYYNDVVITYVQDYFITTYHGAFYRAIEMLQEKYPDLEIIIASGFPMYLKNSDGSLQLGYNTSFTQGTLSDYFGWEYFLSTKYCLSFIDNYYYGITENNITEYVDEQRLTDKGIDLVGGHITDYLKKYVK